MQLKSCFILCLVYWETCFNPAPMSQYKSPILLWGTRYINQIGINTYLHHLMFYEGRWPITKTLNSPLGKSRYGRGPLLQTECVAPLPKTVAPLPKTVAIPVCLHCLSCPTVAISSRPRQSKTAAVSNSQLSKPTLGLIVINGTVIDFPASQLSDLRRPVNTCQNYKWRKEVIILLWSTLSHSQ